MGFGDGNGGEWDMMARGFSVRFLKMKSVIGGPLYVKFTLSLMGY
jgi:hypothetical protein